jgi:non-canonical (house-cleaning) NTP pyrophosphatase
MAASHLSDMEKIILAVGSTRRPKLEAVIDAIRAFAPRFAASGSGAEFDVVGVEVESGVSHTPSSRAELMRGARQRAEALAQLGREKGQPWRYFIGLEGGLDVVADSAAGPTPAINLATQSGAPPDAASTGICRVFLESWAYVSDGTRGYFGRSGGIEFPEALAREVLEKGIELSEAIDRFARIHDPDKFAGASGIRNAQGAWGLLSGDLITRQEAFRVAVIAAFAPFYNAKMYGTPRATGMRDCDKAASRGRSAG